MFESITMNFLTQPKVVAAVDIFRALQTAATSLKNNLMIFAGVAAVASIWNGHVGESYSLYCSMDEEWSDVG
ncbi:hypothetical protein E5925_002035 [Enterococcus faecium]|nr:hypothetical protein [Enterococcus faecium]